MMRDASSVRCFAERFRAAVAYYPGCMTLPRFTAPVAILIGEADDWTSAERCREHGAACPAGQRADRDDGLSGRPPRLRCRAAAAGPPSVRPLDRIQWRGCRGCRSAGAHLSRHTFGAG